jgi:hypothetical protein
MIVKKTWHAHTSGGGSQWIKEGWFLFGFIPLYIRDATVRPYGIKK